jgi:3alpha(or 20beta)-hydroxysteroid dehydrogenase
MDRLAGAVAVVTGAARGIGRAIADAFLAEGATVIGCDVLEPGDAAFTARRLDVTDEAAWSALVATVLADHGRVDVLVNNAGVTGFDDVEALTSTEWDRIIGVDQTGVFLGMRAVIPAMRDAGGGSIVNISSICGAAAVPGLAAYHAAKGAVLLMTKNAAVTYAADGIRANAILPGWIATPMTGGQDDSLNSGFLAATPMGCGGEPADVAWGAVYLASGESRFVTGIELPIDGGYLAA